MATKNLRFKNSSRRSGGRKSKRSSPNKQVNDFLEMEANEKKGKGNGERNEPQEG